MYVLEIVLNKEQSSLHGYVYSENNSKNSNGNIHFFQSQNDQRIEKPLMALERYT